VNSHEIGAVIGLARAHLRGVPLAPGDGRLFADALIALADNVVAKIEPGAFAPASPASKCPACDRTAAAAETLLEVNERLTAQLAEARAKIADLVAYTRRGVTP